MIDLEFQRRHWGVEVNPVEVVHKQYLRVALATITRLRSLAWFADFDYNKVAGAGQY